MNKAIGRDSSVSGMAMRAKSPSDAWTLLKSMVESDDSAIARENSQEFLAMIVGESLRKYVTRAKESAAAVRYHGTAVNDEKENPPTHAFRS